MRLFFVVLLTLLTSLPALAAEKQRWLIFRRGENGKIIRESSEIWIGPRPTIGMQPNRKRGNLPQGCIVKLLPNGMNPKELELNGNTLTRKRKKVVINQPSPAQVSAAEIERRVRDKANDPYVTDAQYVKLLRLKNIADPQTKHKLWQKLKKENSALRE